LYKYVLYHEGTNMHPLGTKVYLLKRYRPSDSFRTFFLEVSYVFRKCKNAETFLKWVGLGDIIYSLYSIKVILSMEFPYKT